MAEPCGDPFSGIGCDVPGCTHDSVATYDDEGWMLDEYGNQYGYCNGCGEESQAERDCCADGEVVPYGS